MKWRPSTTFSLILVFALLAVFALWLSFRVANTAMLAMVDQRELDKVQTVGRMVSGTLDGQSRQVSQAAQLTAGRAELGVALLGRPDYKAIRAVVEDARGVSGLDLLEVVNAEERVLYRSSDPARYGDTSTNWGVYEALQGSGLLASTEKEGMVVLYALQPIRASGRVVGALSVGVPLDDPLFIRIGQEVGAALAMLSPAGKVLASGGTATPRIDQRQVEAAFAQKIPVFVHDEASRKTQAYLPLNIVDNAYVVLVEIDSAAAYAQLDRAKKQAALYTLVILLVSIGAGVLLMRWLMQPLLRLRQRAAGLVLELTGKPVDVDTSSEVGAIVRALDAVANRLVEYNRELAAAKSAADAASLAKSQFLSNMSHEIRTPMNAILGVSSLMRHAGVTAEQSGQLAKIENAGEHLIGVINNILDLSKIEAGKFTLQEEDFRVAALAESLDAVIGDLLRSKGLAFSIDFSALPEALRGDLTRLKQALLNYLGNAAKFTERGSVSLRGEVVESDGVTCLLRFIVTDTGCGLSVEQQQRVFEAFEQADNSTTRHYGGTGLGLTIVKRMAGLMGGDAGVHSVPGQGSSFWLTARLHRAEAAAVITPPVEVQSAASLLQRDFAGRRILLVEDELVNREIVLQFLRLVGMQVDVACDGLEAVQAVSAQPYDMILMDMLMPHMDGLTATREIRRLANGAQVPIIALTANAFADDRERCIAAGMDDFIAKPVNMELLHQRLLRCFRRGKAVSAGG